MIPALAFLSRRWQFVRHVPPGKIARRVQLSLLRRLRDIAGACPLPATRATLRDDLPPQVMPARHGGTVQVDGATMVLHFLGAESQFDLSNMDWSFASPVPSAQLWRMMLHYMEYLEAVDDASFALITQSWLAANGRIRPGAWRDAWNSYALSLRVVVLMQQLAARRAALDPALVTRIGESVAAQVRFLESNLETDIGGNHLIKNIRALLWAARAFDGPDAARWHRLGLRLLLRELRAQVLADGVHYERSPSYHAQVFADLLECRSVLAQPPQALDEALSHMAQALVDLAHPDGFAALFNDAGLTMCYAPAACLGAYAAQTGAAAPVPRALFTYREAGYFGGHLPAASLVVDCGAIAPDDLPAHGHGDLLSFALSVAGQRVVVDPGVFAYIDGARRRRARSAAAHNTLWIKGSDQADFFSAFRCGRRPQAELRAAELSNGADGAAWLHLTGAHDGYSHLPGRPVHCREVAFASDHLTLHDALEGEGTQQAGIGFLLHPDITPVPTAPGCMDLYHDGQMLAQVDGTAPLAIEADAWWPDMGQERRTVRLCATIPQQPRRVTTTIRFGPGGEGA